MINSDITLQEKQGFNIHEQKSACVMVKNSFTVANRVDYIVISTGWAPRQVIVYFALKVT